MQHRALLQTVIKLKWTTHVYQAHHRHFSERKQKQKQNKTNKQIKEKTTGRSLYKRQLFALNDKYYIKAHMDY